MNNEPRDRVENKQGFESAVSSEEVLKFLQEFKDYALIILDTKGNVVNWNAGAEHFYGYTEKEIIGENISVFYLTEDAELGLPIKNLEIAALTGRHEFEVLKCKKDGTHLFTNNILTALYHPDRSLKGFTKITRNIDRQKKLEAENTALTESLEEKVKQRTHELSIANKELEAFSYSVSHDLKAPLRAISGYSEMLREDYSSVLDQEANRFINVIIDNSRMMGQLIDDLLTFSKMARVRLISNSIDMNNLVDTCLSEIRLTTNLNKYSFSVSPLPLCKGDAKMLKLVLFNLLSNAIKYSSKKTDPAIKVGCMDADNHYTYYVADNGAGFDMKYSKNLFGVFQRLHRPDQFEGTGLGLALAQRIVTKHGGKIWAEALLDRGATFYFNIPK